MIAVPKLRAFACSVKGSDWGETTVHAMTRSKARYRHWQHVRDPWPDIKLMDINVRLLGAPRNTPQFEHTKKYRGVSFNIGDRVRVGQSEGFVSDRNDSANFQVQFISGPYAGGELSVHPSDIEACAAEVTTEPEFQSANAGESQPTLDKSEERQQKETR